MPRHVCIIALNAYPAIRPDSGRGTGGLETTAWTLATDLAAQKDLQVSLLLRHNRPVPESDVQGVCLLPIVDRFRDVRLSVANQVLPQSGFPWYRLRQPRWRLPWQLIVLAATRYFRDRRPTSERIASLLHRARPDVCVSLGNGSHSAAVVHAAQQLHAASIVWVQSNADLDRRFFEDDRYVNPYGESAASCRFVLENATAIFCQTRRQQQLLATSAERPSFLIPTPIRASDWADASQRAFGGDHVLWVGRYDRFHKRPHLGLALALRCPELRFLMVINPGEAAVESEIRGQLPDNVQLLDYVPRNEMPALMRRSRIFLSTGSPEYEGFPNVFLEAAAAGTPLVALHDFDDFIRSSGCGRCADGQLDTAAQLLRELWHEPDPWHACCQLGQAWVRTHYDHQAVVQVFRAALDQIAPAQKQTGTD